MTNATFSLVSYLLAAMHAWVPVSAHAYYEKAEQTEARYESIAVDIAEVVQDPQEPSVFPEEHGGQQLTAVLLASVASFEGGFNGRVDVGQPINEQYDNDGGLAVGQWQTHVYGKTREGWTRDDLAGDRKKAVRVALRMVRDSFTICRRLSLFDRLSAYAIGHGTCVENKESRNRVNRAVDWWKANKLHYLEQQTAQNP